MAIESFSAIVDRGKSTAAKAISVGSAAKNQTRQHSQSRNTKYLVSCRELVRQKPSPSAFCALFKALALASEWDEAQDAILDARARFPHDLVVALEASKVSATNNGLFDASLLLEDAINNQSMSYDSQNRIQPDSMLIQCRKELAKIYASLQKHEEAVNLLKRNSELNDDETIGLWSNEEYELNKDLSAAIKIVDDAVSKNNPQGNNKFKLYYARFKLSKDSNDLHQSIESWIKYLKLTPDANAVLPIEIYNSIIKNIGRLPLDAINLLIAEVIQRRPASKLILYLRARLRAEYGDFQAAIRDLRLLLENDEHHYEALALYIEIANRCGILRKSQDRFLSAEFLHKKVQISGLKYCNALYYKFTGNVANAAQLFKECLKFSEWRSAATEKLLELLLLPSSADFKAPCSNDALEVAKELLMSLEDEASLRMWSLLIQMGPKSKNCLEKVLEMDLQFPEDSVHGLYIRIYTLILLQKEAKLKPLLKKMTQIEWQYSCALPLEAAWQIAAEFYRQQGNREGSDTILKNLLSCNAASFDAIQSYAKLSEDDIPEIALQYWTKAWRLSDFCDVSVGLKFAETLLKMQRVEETISVCHKLLDLEPRSKQGMELLNKARGCLRC